MSSASYSADECPFEYSVETIMTANTFSDYKIGLCLYVEFENKILEMRTHIRFLAHSKALHGVLREFLNGNVTYLSNIWINVNYSDTVEENFKKILEITGVAKDRVQESLDLLREEKGEDEQWMTGFWGLVQQFKIEALLKAA
jgi:hypothetical protein